MSNIFLKKMQDLLLIILEKGRWDYVRAASEGVFAFWPHLGSAYWFLYDRNG
jgi:hypothetical protein